MTTEVIRACLMAGLPLFAISFVLIGWAYRTGAIHTEDYPLLDLEADLKKTEQEISEITSEFEQDSKDKADSKDKKSGNLVLNKWMEFGGGYYGIMALLTFIHLEFFEILDLGADLLAIDGLSSFINLTINFLIQLVIESVMNFINAILWWMHWGKLLPISEGYGFLWLGVSYAGYLLGEWLAGFMFKKPKDEDVSE